MADSMNNRPRRGPGRGMMPVEKAKDFKGSIGKLLAYIGHYKIAIIIVMIIIIYILFILIPKIFFFF